MNRLLIILFQFVPAQYDIYLTQETLDFSNEYIKMVTTRRKLRVDRITIKPKRQTVLEFRPCKRAVRRHGDSAQVVTHATAV